jgi:hypothetical protein
VAGPGPRGSAVRASKANPLTTYALNLKLTNPDGAQAFAYEHLQSDPLAVSTWEGVESEDALLVQDGQAVLQPGALLLALLAIASVTWPGPPGSSTSWTLPSPCRHSRGARAMIKPQYRNMVEPGAPFGAEVSPAPGADDWERLAAFTGRDPRTTPGPSGASAAPGPRST